MESATGKSATIGLGKFSTEYADVTLVNLDTGQATKQRLSKVFVGAGPSFPLGSVTFGIELTEDGTRTDTSAQLLTELGPVSLEMSTSGDATTIKLGVQGGPGNIHGLRVGLVNVGASHSMVIVPANTVARYGGPKQYGDSKGYGNFVREFTRAELAGRIGGSYSDPLRNGPTFRQILGDP